VFNRISQHSQMQRKALVRLFLWGHQNPDLPARVVTNLKLKTDRDAAGLVFHTRHAVRGFSRHVGVESHDRLSNALRPAGGSPRINAVNERGAL
jgi:hypothetical protein